MSARDDGGQAFPVPSCSGMTLRDYFAAKALAGLLGSAITYSDELSHTGNSETPLDVFMAVMAYRYADAMLEARRK